MPLFRPSPTALFLLCAAFTLAGCAVTPAPVAERVKGAGRELTLVEAGRAAAVIVLPPGASATERHAAEELRFYLKEISGATLPIAQTGVPGAAKKIRLAVVPGGAANLGPEGFQILTRGDELLITGGGPRGLLYGVHALLEEQFGCRWFATDATRIPKQATVKLPPLAIAGQPRFEYRQVMGACGLDADWAVHNRVNAGPDFSKAQGGSMNYVPGYFVHTADKLVPPATYFAAHPEYYALVKGKRKISQLCLTNPEVKKIALEEVRRQLRAHPQADVISVSQNDGGGACECPACKAVVAREGTQAGPVLEWVNFVAAGIRDEFPAKAVETLAYYYSEKPPKALKPLPNVIIRLCSYGCCSGHPLATCHDAGSAGFRANLEGWNRLTNRIWVWDYVINFKNFHQPFPNFPTLQPNARYFAAHGVSGVLEQGDYKNRGGELQDLRAYLLAKLLWNPDCDIAAAREDFLRGYYGPAADDLRLYVQLQDDMVRGPDAHVGLYDSSFADYLTPAFLAKATALFDHAEAAVAGRPDLLRRVRSARLGVDYVTLAQWQPGVSALSRAQIVALSKRYLANAAGAQVETVREIALSPEEFVKGVLARQKKQ